MININLAPEEALENPLWYLPDILMVVLVFGIAYGAYSIYNSYTLAAYQAINTEIADLKAQTEALREEEKKTDDANKEAQVLQEKLTEIKPFSTRGVDRYSSIIGIEHLQNLRPDGVWFTSLIFEQAAVVNTAGIINGKVGAANTDATKAAETPKSPVVIKTQFPTIRLKGYGFDNVLIAEFITGLRATMTQEIDPANLRTLVYFKDVVLVASEQKLLSSAIPATSETDRDRKVFQFELILKFAISETNGTADQMLSKMLQPLNTSFATAEM